MQHFTDGALVVVDAAASRKDVNVCRGKVFVKLGAIPIIMGIFRILDNPQNLLIARNSTAILQRTGAFTGEDLYADVAEADVFVFIPADRSGKSPRYTPRPLGSVHQRSHERGDDFIRVDVIHNAKEVYRRLLPYWSFLFEGSAFGREILPVMARIRDGISECSIYQIIFTPIS